MDASNRDYVSLETIPDYAELFENGYAHVTNVANDDVVIAKAKEWARRHGFTEFRIHLYAYSLYGDRLPHTIVSLWGKRKGNE